MYYEAFAQEYLQHYGYDKGEKHKEQLWNKYWSAKFIDIKTKDWQNIKSKLEKNYQMKANNINRQTQVNAGPVAKSIESFASVSSPAESSADSFIENKFTIEGTLSLLEKMNTYLGMLGPAIVAIVESARNAGTTTREALAIFTDEENVVLINMILDKLKIFLPSAPANLCSTIMRTINWTKELLEQAKNPPKETEANLNLEAIAKASLGKDSAFILNLIKTALAYEGIKSLSKEEINKIFMKVCSMHFEMAMKKEKYG